MVVIVEVVVIVILLEVATVVAGFKEKALAGVVLVRILVVGKKEQK